MGPTFCFQLKTALHPTRFNGQALSLMPFTEHGQWHETLKVSTKRSLSLRRHRNCLVLSELLVVCSSESLTACQISLWLCMSPPQWDTGTEKPCKAPYLPPSSNKLQQEHAEEKSLHQADECGLKTHCFCHSPAAARRRCLRAGKSSRERKHIPVPVALLHNYSCIRLHDRCHWGKPALLLLGLQSAGRQPWVNLLLEQGDLAGIC